PRPRVPSTRVGSGAHGGPTRRRPDPRVGAVVGEAHPGAGAEPSEPRRAVGITRPVGVTAGGPRLAGVAGRQARGGAVPRAARRRAADGWGRAGRRLAPRRGSRLA